MLSVIKRLSVSDWLAESRDLSLEVTTEMLVWITINCYMLKCHQQSEAKRTVMNSNKLGLGHIKTMCNCLNKSFFNFHFLHNDSLNKISLCLSLKKFRTNLLKMLSNKLKVTRNLWISKQLLLRFSF